MPVSSPSKGVPRTHNTLTKTPSQTVVVRDVAPGQYTHFGIQNFLLTVSDSFVLAMDEIVIDIGNDGAPFANSSAL